MIFTKSAFANEAAKNIDFRVVLQPKIHEKSPWFCTCKRYRNFLPILIEFHEFPVHFGLQNTPPNHLKIDSGRFWRQSGIDLVLQGRIWMDSERLGLDFLLIWVRFCLYFEWIERGFCKQSLDEQYALVAALNMALLLYIAFSRWHLVRRGAHRAWNPPKIRRTACGAWACQTNRHGYPACMLLLTYRGGRFGFRKQKSWWFFFSWEVILALNF